MKKIFVLIAVCAMMVCASCGTSSSEYVGRPYPDRQEPDTSMTESERREMQQREELFDARERIDELESALYDAEQRAWELEQQMERINYNVMPEDAKYKGDLLSYLYHRMSCEYPKSETYCTYYFTEEEALKDGMSPCPECKP